LAANPEAETKRQSHGTAGWQPEPRRAGGDFVVILIIPFEAHDIADCVRLIDSP
jgi:hypothetical protein